MKLSFASLCKKGGRQYNQDYVSACVRQGSACMVVCDGLGSYAGSEDASRLCSHSIVSDYINDVGQNCTVDEAVLAKYIANAHEYIVQYKVKKPAISSSCTTVAAIVTDCQNTVISHIGDTRVYYFREGKLHYQTLDHSMAQAAVERGEIELSDIRRHKDQNKLTKVLGSEECPQTDTTTLKEALMAGDWLVMCTDGWWEYVYEEEMEGILRISASPEDALNKMEKRLARRAPYNSDNFSAIVALVGI